MISGKWKKPISSLIMQKESMKNPIQSKGFIIDLEVFFEEKQTANKDTATKTKFIPFHQKGITNKTGVNKQCTKHNVEDITPKTSDFLAIKFTT